MGMSIGYSKRLEKITNTLYVVPFVALIFLFVIIPSISIFVGSLFKQLLDGSQVYVGTENFLKILRDGSFLPIAYNTIIWLVSTVVFKNGIGLVLALTLCINLKINKVLSFTALVTWATPWIISTLIFKWIFDGLYGYLNGLLFVLNIIDQPIDFLGSVSFAIWGPIITNIWTAIAFCAFTYLAAILSIPQYLYEAAELDGANKFRQFQHITFPHLIPTMKLLVLLTSLWGLNSFDMIYTMTGGGPLNASETFVTQIYRLGFVLHSPGKANAFSVIAFIVMMGFSYVYIRSIKKGIEYV